ncbi:hypothetical protein SI3_01474 [Enterococcus faecium EnGen0147]|nr:hypothetical protein SI3_01474 [Enterococcus faecium EnGen0147]
MKTPLTIEIESSLYQYCIEQGGLVVEEVTMPDDQGIVDTLSCLTKFDGSREWRCYELKVTKADFALQPNCHLLDIIIILFYQVNYMKK